VTTHALFQLISTYAPPNGSPCVVNQDNSDCAVFLKNSIAFDSASTNCATAAKTTVLVYAPNGPVAEQNNNAVCGSVISNGVLVKNGEAIYYDQQVEHTKGFGSGGYVIGTWKELAPS
jgi:hypothetical protein